MKIRKLRQTRFEAFHRFIVGHAIKDAVQESRRFGAGQGVVGLKAAVFVTDGPTIAVDLIDFLFILVTGNVRKGRLALGGLVDGGDHHYEFAAGHRRVGTQIARIVRIQHARLQRGVYIGKVPRPVL